MDIATIFTVLGCAGTWVGVAIAMYVVIKDEKKK